MTYPPVPEALVVPVYDNHTHLEMRMDGSTATATTPQSTATMPISIVTAAQLAAAEADAEHDPAERPLDPFEQLDRASSVGVRGVVQVGTDLVSSRWSAEFAAREPRVLAAVALHPNDTPELARDGLLDEHLAGIAELASQPRVRAIGETGLDYYRTDDAAGRDAQLRSFEAHIAIAKEFGLALQIHDRDAHRDVIDTLERVGAPERTVFHCFSGDAGFARHVTERGWYCSFAGTVTFKNAQDLRDALEVIPRSRILVETDAPFLTPMPHRGATNSPYLIPWTVRSMAQTLGTDVSMLSALIASNTELVYGHWDDVPVVTPTGPFDDHPEGTPTPA